MMLRALSLLAVLALHPMAGAAGELFHLCEGTAQLNLTCCCDHSTGEQLHAESAACAIGAEAGCCDELTVEVAPFPAATTAPEHSWNPVPILAVVSEVAAAPHELNATTPAWIRTGGVYRATAPPLYIQNCSYLI